MLADRLLKKVDFETPFETRTLELLKLRFAESELHHCDVMLKDMQARRLPHATLHCSSRLPTPASHSSGQPAAHDADGRLGARAQRRGQPDRSACPAPQRRVRPRLFAPLLAQAAQL